MFELHITCTKDIDKLEINFSDGTSVVTSNSDKPEIQGQPITSNIPETRNQILDTSRDFGTLKPEAITKPDTFVERDAPKIASELQNFEL